MTFQQKDGSVTTAATDRYPYTHHGPAVYGCKLVDYLISEAALRVDRPDLFKVGDA